MKDLSASFKSYFKKPQFRKNLKRVGYLCVGFLGIVLISFIGLRIYFIQNKTKIVSEINREINDNITGHVSIGDIGYKFLIGFPNFTVVLNQVEVKDSLYPIHKRTLLKAKEIEVRLNVLALLRNEVNIHKIVINDATIDLFKDKKGVSNSNIFKPKPKKDKTKKTGTTSIDQIALDQVNFISENQQRNKLFHFEVASLESQLEYNDAGWSTNLSINTFAKSMAFNTKKGSFIKNKKVEGTLAVDFSKAQNRINVSTEGLEIGDDSFDIKAHFGLEKEHPMMDIDIKTNILWSNAYNLLSNNIVIKLSQFAMEKPIQVGCTIKGDMSVQGDPEIIVHAEIKDNTIKLPDGSITDCNFLAQFTNNYKQGLGYNDANSAIIINNLRGSYKEIPISISKFSINNLDNPIAIGELKSKFDVTKLSGIVADDFIQFYSGNAEMNLKFQVDIVGLKMVKPRFTGAIDIKQAHLIYKPKNLTFKTDIKLDFTDEALWIRNIKYQNGKNIVFIEGKIDSFLNLYYDAPEKMVAVLNFKSPYMDAEKFLKVMAFKGNAPAIKEKKKVDKNPGKLPSVINKCQVDINLQIEKMVYRALTANNAKFTLTLKNNLFEVKNSSLQTCDGIITINAQIQPQGNLYQFNANANISGVDIPKFLKSFNNFGIKSFQPQNIQGKLFATASIGGNATAKGDLIDKSVKGDLKYNVKNGALVNFEPIVKVGRFAFPNRDVKNIYFSDLSGELNIQGELVNVDYIKGSSNVLNFDIVGVYSFKRGTNLGMSIPLRDPKADAKIKDKAEREAQRNKGVVLHLLAVDDNKGGVKIKWGNYKQLIN